MANSKYDAIVIGAGVGGLGCAALLGKKGLKTLLLEKNERTGGRVMAFEENGYKYELWPTGPSPVYGHNLEVLCNQELGLTPGVNLIPPKNFTCWYKGRSGKWNKSDDINTYLPGRDPDPTCLFDLWEMDEKETNLAIQVLGDIYAMEEDQLDVFDEEDISFAEYLERFEEIPPQVHNFLAFMATAMLAVPIDTISAYEYIKTLQQIWKAGGGGYPEGGCGSIVDQLTEAVTANGGEIRASTKIRKITIENGRVTGVITERDEKIEAPIVVSSAGIHATVLKLVGEEHFDKSYISYIKDLVSCWGWTGQIYFLNKEVFPFDMFLAYSDKSWWDTERYAKVREEQTTDEVIVFGMVNNNYDPSLAPPGKQVLAFGTACSGDPTAAETELLMDKHDELLFQLYPEMESAIERKIRGGPAEVSAMVRDYVLPGQGGEWGGLAMAVGQSGKNRPSPKSPISGLFYVGLDVGGGQMGLHMSSRSAMVTAKKVDQYHKLRKSVMQP